ncbi:hypothetical protein GQ457_01G030490 [Hibiscus cannabinus]
MGVVTRETEITSPLPPTKLFKAFALDLTPFFPRPSPTRSRPSSSSKATAASEVSRRSPLPRLGIELFEAQGELLKNKYERIRFETKFVATPNGGTICKMTAEYYTVGDVKMVGDQIEAENERRGRGFKAVRIISCKSRCLKLLRLYFNRRKQDSTQCLTPSSRRISFFILSSNCNTTRKVNIKEIKLCFIWDPFGGLKVLQKPKWSNFIFIRFIYSVFETKRNTDLTREHFLDLLDFNAIDDMCRRMDGVEKSVYDLRAELGGGNAPPSFCLMLNMISSRRGISRLYFIWYLVFLMEIL